MGIPALSNDSEALQDELSELAGEVPTLEEHAGLSFANGLITAVIVSPRFVDPADWMPLLIDNASGDATDLQAEVARVLIMTEYRSILDSLAARDGGYEPYYWEDEEGRLITRDWAEGFLAGMALCKDAWDRILKEDEERRVDLVTIFVLSQDDEFFADILGEDGGSREESESIAQRELPLAIQGFFELSPHGSRRDEAVSKEAGKKVGRNDPCPCGSGKKFKKCCLN